MEKIISSEKTVFQKYSLFCNMKKITLFVINTNNSYKNQDLVNIFTSITKESILEL